ncbi:MAG: hypothetical protein ABEJ72_00490 [Candidatus Aenigmatarchaeota archaeon]
MVDLGYSREYTEDQADREKREKVDESRAVAGTSADDEGEVNFVGNITVDEMLNGTGGSPGRKLGESFSYDDQGDVSLSASGVGRKLVWKPSENYVD